MAEQFIHKYILEFGQPVSFYEGQGVFDVPSYAVSPIPFKGPESTKDPLQLDSYVDKLETDSAVRITGLNISFDIDKSKEAGNPSTLVIYNISDGTSKFLEQWQGKSPLLLLRAGYETDTELPIIFQGEIESYSEVFEGHTRKTTLQLKSGSSSIKEAYTVKSYRSGTSVEKIFEDLIADLKLPKGTIYYPRGNEVQFQVINKPVIINTPTAEFLRRFSKDNGYKFWIEDGVVNVYPENYVLRAGEFIFDINSSTNMIGSPVVTDGSPSVQEKQAWNKSLITVKTTLNGAYTLTSKVRVTSRFYNGIYEIIGLKHVGTYEGSEWYSTLELKQVDGWEEA